MGYIVKKIGLLLEIARPKENIWKFKVWKKGEKDEFGIEFEKKVLGYDSTVDKNMQSDVMITQEK